MGKTSANKKVPQANAYGTLKKISITTNIHILFTIGPLADIHPRLNTLIICI